VFADLAYYEYLDSLGIEYSTVLTWNVGHNPGGICTPPPPPHPPHPSTSLLVVQPLPCHLRGCIWLYAAEAADDQGGCVADEKNGHDIMLFHARNFGQLGFQ
jgi:hypothetical protein